MIGLCNVGGDMENCVKQAAEFNLANQGIRMAALLGFITEAKSMGLETAQGLLLPGIFYWDMNDRTRAFTKRFRAENTGQLPERLACGVLFGDDALSEGGGGAGRGEGEDVRVGCDQLDEGEPERG